MNISANRAVVSICGGDVSGWVFDSEAVTAHDASCAQVGAWRRPRPVGTAAAAVDGHGS